MMGWRRGLTSLVAVCALSVVAVPAAATPSIADEPAPPVDVDRVVDDWLDGPPPGADASFRYDQICEEMTHSVWRLYSAFFLRAPDSAGLEYWVGEYQSGRGNLDVMANSFVVSDEFRLTYGSLNDAQFIDLVYLNVLGRLPDAEGRAHWLGALGNGSLSRGELMISFSESEEYVILTGTFAPAAGYGQWYPPGTEWACVHADGGDEVIPVQFNGTNLAWLDVIAWNGWTSGPWVQGFGADGGVVVEAEMGYDEVYVGDASGTFTDSHYGNYNQLVNLRALAPIRNINVYPSTNFGRRVLVVAMTVPHSSFRSNPYVNGWPTPWSACPYPTEAGFDATYHQPDDTLIDTLPTPATRRVEFTLWCDYVGYTVEIPRDGELTIAASGQSTGDGIDPVVFASNSTGIYSDDDGLGNLNSSLTIPVVAGDPVLVKFGQYFPDHGAVVATFNLN